MECNFCQKFSYKRTGLLANCFRVQTFGCGSRHRGADLVPDDLRGGLPPAVQRRALRRGVLPPRAVPPGRLPAVRACHGSDGGRGMGCSAVRVKVQCARAQ